MMKKHKWSKTTLERIIKNIISIEGICPCLTANAMQSVNHQNCVLIMERENGEDVY